MSTEYPNYMEFEYTVAFERTASNYRLMHYNSPWDGNERELEDIRLMLEGKDLAGKEFPSSRIVEMDKLAPGKYELRAKMILLRTKPEDRFEQSFRLDKFEALPQ